MKIKYNFFEKYIITSIEQLTYKIFILNSYLTIVIFCKNNNISFVYLIFDKKILNIKIIKKSIVLF